MLVSDLMSTPVHAAKPNDTVSYARNQMLRHKISRILVIEDGRALGIITKKDIGFRLRRNNPQWRHRQIDNEPLIRVMSTDLVRLSPDSSIRDALLLLLAHQISGAPVIDQGMVLGILTRTDILRSKIVDKLDIPVTELMHEPVQVTPQHSHGHVVDLIKNGAEAVIVVDDGGAVGIITDTDLAFYEDHPDTAGSGTAAGIMRSSILSLPETARTREAVAVMLETACQSVIISGENGVKGIITRDDIIREVVQ
ncbi:CBS domain-containing protein [Methanospirillum sp. J.3.6.1-F.2.7.3]|jgi:CBS domain-containing protein|uniref:CBS domain-containing protein n=1 Tax=Methanospirillum purgamenti TaxID=2834276 RepID=A0A8E7AZZ0_9EURY|nr:MULTISPECIES: CBS domain-containing protein [Methanospirillum]MDX8549298.1 CBS domain-containing protein [Methanospirillum hungatei]NLW74827.1 CBS domain-containing protein [Methanomicrobiales archaeon]QVV89404.1 CBS domain-containing protein [Methanospirillum sp. J.3.6.1-F.2.7.3]